MSPSRSVEDADAYRLAVVRGVISEKVVVFWNLPSRMFVCDCFYPGATEGCLDSDAIFPYIWGLEFSKRGDEPFELSSGIFARDQNW